MPEETGHEDGQIGDGNGDDVHRTHPGTGNATPRMNEKPNDATLNLIGFSVPLPQPVRGVKREAQVALRKIDKNIGGQRLAIDTHVSAPPRNKETMATTTVPGPPQTARDLEAQNDPKQADHEGTEAESDNPFFAVPGGPGIQVRDPGREGDPNAFFHPASKEPQRVIWLPRDDLGLCEAEVQKNRECGVESSCRYARLTSEGKVRISGRPPGDRQ